MFLDKLKQECSLVPNIKQQRNNQRYLHGKYPNNQCHKENRIPKYVTLDEKLMQHCLDLVEVGVPEPLSIICRAATPINAPVELSSPEMEILVDSFQTCRRITSASEHGNFDFACTCAVCPSNEITRPLVPWFFDTAMGADKVRNLLKIPLVCRLGDLDSNMSFGKMKSVRVKDTKCSEIISFASDLSIYSPGKPVVADVPLGGQEYRPEITDNMPAPCLSTNSTFSCRSTSEFATASEGLIYCVWKRGIPYFLFSSDDLGEVYTANPYNVESLDDKTLDYIYIFRSGTVDQKERGGCGNNISGFVGKMKVSSSVMLSSTNLKLRETEFVLFGASEDLMDMQNSTPTHRKGKRLSKTTVDISRMNSSKSAFATEFGHPRSVFDDFCQEPPMDISCMCNELDKGKLLFNPNLQLATIVVKNHHCAENQERGVGGWGLNFLSRTAVQCTGGYSQSSSESCEGCSLRNENNGLISMNVLIPAGFHGGPRTKNSSPSSLTERWKSGGHCDCGGWDVGCLLTVLSTKSSKEDDGREMDAQEDCSSFDLFIEGSNEGVPTLKMMNVHEGLYYIRFEKTLSALQCFSIGVAIIHAQTPALRPNL